MIGDGRLGALVVGPGLGRDPATTAAVRQIVLESSRPRRARRRRALSPSPGRPACSRDRPGLVLTPHAGELAALLGEPVGDVTKAHLAAARRAAAATGQVVLLKGSSTIVADPAGQVRAVVQGPPQLASAGTGDVLSGVIGALAGQRTGAVRSRVRRRLVARRGRCARGRDRSPGSPRRRPGRTTSRGHRRPHL